jgi:transglutaminase-like putative cysteine protease
VHSRADGLPALVRMVTLLTLYRCLQYRRRREDLQLVLLCLFMIVLSGVLTLSLLFGVQILVFAVMAMALLFVINLLQADPARALTRGDWAHFRWRSFLVRLLRGMDLRLHLLAALLFAALVGTSTVIFVSMPRFSFEHSMSFTKLKGQSGFNEKVSYGQTDSLTLDDAVAFRVDAPTGVVFASTPYWRMIVLDQYENNEFQASYPHDFERRESFIPNSSGPRLADTQRPPGVWKFYLEGDVSEYLPVLGPFEKLTFSMPQSFSANTFTQVYRIQETSTNVLGYEILDMDFGQVIPASRQDITHLRKTVAEPPPAGRPLHYPQNLYGLPNSPLDREYLKQTVAEIRAQSKSPGEMEFVQKAIDYLHEHHSGANSLNLKPLPEGSSRDALVHWMMSNSAGWCEYFAGSFVLLARTAGYPARVVAGYKGATFNAIEHYYVVRNSNAHAWAEIFDGKDRWLRVDPTPGAEMPFFGAIAAAQVAPMKFEKGWSARLDSLRMLWYRRVINFDQTDQQEFASTLSSYVHVFITSIKEQLREYAHTVSQWMKAPLTSHRIRELSLLIGVLALGLIFRRWLMDAWLRLSAGGWLARVSHDSPVRRRAGRWLVQLEPAWQSWAAQLPAAVQGEGGAARPARASLRPAGNDAGPAGGL